MRIAAVLFASLLWVSGALAGESRDHELRAAEHASYDRFIGTWDVGYEIYDKDGRVRRYRGQVVYSWILDGSALQENWTSNSHNETPQPYGTLIGFHDGVRRRWTEVWIYPERGVVTVMSGGHVNGGIVLTGRNESGALERWSTSDIQPDSFVSRFETSADQGKTWRLLGVNHMQRHRA